MQMRNSQLGGPNWFSWLVFAAMLSFESSDGSDAANTSKTASAKGEDEEMKQASSPVVHSAQ